MVRIVSISSTIRTQPASIFLLTVQLLKVPLGHHASACLIPLTQKLLPNTSLKCLIIYDIRVLKADPMVKFIIIINA